MAQDRYNRVFLLPEHLHAKGLPFEIEAGALLIDGKTGDALVQLKMASQADSHVKAVKVSIQPSDVRGETLGDPVTHQYLDLDVLRDESFGQKEPITLPDNSTRSFSILSAEVVYDDNSMASSDAEWVPLPEQEALKATISDEELLKQYQLDYGEGCQYQLQELGDLWRCVCGATNRDDEDACHSCGQQHDALRAIDRETLEEHKNARLEAERLEHEAQLEKERLEKEEAERTAAEKKKKTKKAALIGAAIAAVAIAAYLVASVTIIPASKYSKAVNMLEAGDYESAKAVFISLGEYQDAQSKIDECNVGIREGVKAKAAELILQGSYDDAASACSDSGVTNSTEENKVLFAEAERLAIKNSEVGDTVTYGRYANKDYAQWVVLDKDDEGAMLLCNLCLFKTALGESHPNPKYDWTGADFRGLMNRDDTLSQIFTSYEIEGIISKEHVYDGDLDEQKSEFKAGSEKKCTDKLFCPSSADVLKLVPVARERISSYNGTGIFWWLSDVDPDPAYPDSYLCFRAVSWSDGSVSSWPADQELGVRPAMWVSFE